MTEDFDRLHARYGAATHLLDYLSNPSNDREVVLWSLAVKAKEASHNIWLAVGKGVSPEGYFVSFHEGVSASDALVGWIERAKAGSLKWHDDAWPPDGER